MSIIPDKKTKNNIFNNFMGLAKYENFSIIIVCIYDKIVAFLDKKLTNQKVVYEKIFTG